MKVNQVPTYGFGAYLKFPNLSKGTSHCFPCSGDYDRPAGFGVDGIFDLYAHCLKNVSLDGPTYFAPLIKNVVEQTKQDYKNNPDAYTVLLILTDGCIHDMAQTKDWIVEGSYLPLSIIIIGIGDADFSNMEVLDSDDQVG